MEVDKKVNFAMISAFLMIIALGFTVSFTAASPGTITGSEDDTPGVWLFSAGTDTEAGGQPTDEIVENAIEAGIVELIGDEASEIEDFHAGPSEPYEGARDSELSLVVEGLSAIDDFGLIEEPDDPSSNFDAGLGGWVTLSNFGEIHPDGVVATGTIGPEEGVDPEEALGGFEIFIFEDAELSGFICTLTLKSGGSISFTIADRQINPNTPDGADDTLIAIDLDSLQGFTPGDAVVSIKITDDGISMTEPVYGDTTLELDAVATRVGVLYGSISGYKWNDLDGDGVKDADEPGLEGWTIVLSGETSATTTTNEDGYYEFTGLPAGSYTVSEVAKPDWVQTYPPSPGTYSIELSPGENSVNNNFGNKYDAHGPGVGGVGEVAQITSLHGSLVIYLLVSVLLLTLITVSVIFTAYRVNR
ncbi:carboxypeptidase regulatory-like domain-containing protein [Candidatus Bathyarchaeota archaeon]|nr:carboxypeptidase regulatory-like domain-containing protein [Candidatus Bathyarchaeota archaeon]